MHPQLYHSNKRLNILRKFQVITSGHYLFSNRFKLRTYKTKQDRNLHKDNYLRPLLTGACSLLTFLKKSSCKLLLQIKNEVLKNLDLTRYETI